MFHVRYVGRTGAQCEVMPDKASAEQNKRTRMDALCSVPNGPHGTLRIYTADECPCSKVRA